VPRQRTARLAVLGSSAQRSAGSEFSSRSRGPLRRRLVVTLLAVASLAVLTGTLLDSHHTGPLARASGIASDVMRPFEVAAHRVASPFVDAYDYFAGLFGAKHEASQLRKDLEKARQVEAENAGAASENADLRAALHYIGLPSFPHDFNGVATAVAAHGWPEPASAIIVNGGKHNGIAVGDAVVDAHGYLVGTVTSTSSASSRVTLLTDSNIAVSARDASTPAEGLVVSSVDSQGTIRLFLDRVAKSARVNEGDEVVTAGWHYQDIKSLYPGGIPIGRVLHVGQSDVDETQQIQLKPFANLGALETVIVLVPKAGRGG
jgi:rod shape-determining protein MreC